MGGDLYEGDKMPLKGALYRRLKKKWKGKSTKQMERELAKLEAREKILQKREAMAERMKYLKAKRSTLRKVGKAVAKGASGYARHLAKQQARASRRAYRRPRRRKRPRRKTYRRRRTTGFEFPF